jgi:hypothetical protein
VGRCGKTFNITERGEGIGAPGENRQLWRNVDKRGPQSHGMQAVTDRPSRQFLNVLFIFSNEEDTAQGRCAPLRVRAMSASAET